jgi:predicted TIM-barrel fold metal-dependent hydrolase
MRMIDMHMHVKGAGTEWSWDHNDRIIEAADALGIEQLVVSFPVVRGMPDYARVRQCNDAVIDCMRQYEGRIQGWCYVIAGQKQSLDEIDRCLDAGMVGIKLYNQYKIWDPAVQPVLEKAIDEGLPVLEHAGHSTTRLFRDQQPNISDAADFVRAACLYPECMLIEAHIGGGGDWEWSIRQLREAPSVYLDTSGSIIDERMIEMCVEELGEERLLFGTDMTMEGGVGKMLAADINKAQREKICFRNWENIISRRRQK